MLAPTVRLNVKEAGAVLFRELAWCYVSIDVLSKELRAAKDAADTAGLALDMAKGRRVRIVDAMNDLACGTAYDSYTDTRQPVDPMAVLAALNIQPD